MYEGRKEGHQMCCQCVGLAPCCHWTIEELLLLVVYNSFLSWKASITLFSDQVWVYSLDDIRKHCLQEFRAHWSCLEDNNHQLWNCRQPEKKLYGCIFENLVRMILRS